MAKRPRDLKKEITKSSEAVADTAAQPQLDQALLKQLIEIQLDMVELLEGLSRGILRVLHQFATLRTDDHKPDTPKS